ncbi:acyltransferase family protein [Amycolatopsis sp. H20-H5]|uniref:acyltransferase family protein n=1 Tax=Amycolatopsis sp. H20-H5 TaxID=3046309 RepID=UPI003FA3C0E7
MPTGQRTPRRISWDILRVVAIVAVMLGHVTHQSALLHPELSGYPFRVTAQFGASILLTISAYFVCASLRKGSPGRWLWSRVARLVPVYLVAVLLTYVVTRYAVTLFNGQALPGGIGGFLFGVPSEALNAGPVPWYTPTGLDLFANLTMIQAWSFDFQYLDGSYWTLPVQLMAFTAAALLWPRRWRTDRRVVVLLWALIAVPVVIRFVVFTPETIPPALNNIFFGLGLHRLNAFAFGVAAWFWAQRRLPTWHLGLLLVATVAAQDLQMFPLHHPTPIDPERVPSIVGFAVMLILVCLAARGPDWDVPFVRRLRPVITWIAGISFGLYLVHQELGYILARVLLDRGVPGWLRLVAVLGAAVLGGWLLTKLVERPVHRVLTARRGRPVPAEPVAEGAPGAAPSQVEGVAPVSVGGAS